MSDLDLELLKKDVNILTSVCEKLDISIDKMQEIASNLSRMVSLQEQRLEIQEKTTREIESVLEMRRVEHNNDIKELHSRITTVNRELAEKIESTEKHILHELQELRSELKTEKNSLGGRILNIETWKWMIVGGAIVVSWLAGRAIDILKVIH